VVVDTVVVPGGPHDWLGVGVVGVLLIAAVVALVAAALAVVLEVVLGALFGKLGKTGMNKEVLEQMGDAVPPGKAGWFLLIGQMTEDKFLAAVQGTQATLVRSNLSHEQEEELKQAFGTEKHAQD
jgi:uncharacterized membrane protein